MRSWIAALARLKKDYPTINAVIEISADGMVIRLSTMYGKQRVTVDRMVPNDDIDGSFIDFVKLHLAEAVSEIILFPENHLFKPHTVGGKDYEQVHRSDRQLELLQADPRR